MHEVRALIELIDLIRAARAGGERLD